jgi:acyl dehydratase
LRAAHTTLRYDEVGVGDELPVLEVPITATAIVAGAIASRDYQDVHHDRELAKLRGSPDIFMNILTTNGYVGRFVTDWAGPDAQLRVVDIVLGAPNYPGDVMRLCGRVTSKQQGVITLEVRGANRLGDHVKGSVELSLPGSEASR